MSAGWIAYITWQVGMLIALRPVFRMIAFWDEDKETYNPRDEDGDTIAAIMVFTVLISGLWPVTLAAVGIWQYVNADFSQIHKKERQAKRISKLHKAIASAEKELGWDKESK
jgi:hypothetical protein